MKNFTHGQVIGIPVVSSKTTVEEDLPSISLSESQSIGSTKERRWPSFNWMKKFRRSSKHNSQGLRSEALSQKSSETSKRNRSLGNRVLQVYSGVEKAFRKSFTLDQDERLLKGHYCYLYTTAGPIKGLFFMSTKKIAFSSAKPLLFTSPKGEILKVPYKVLIPVSKIKEATPRKNVSMPGEDFLHIVTIDNFEFWFSGNVKQKESSKGLQEALSKF